MKDRGQMGPQLPGGVSGSAAQAGQSCVEKEEDMKKAFGTFALFVTLIGTLAANQSVFAQAGVGIEQVIAWAGPMIAKEAIPQIRNLPHQLMKLGWLIGGRKHTVWYCRYADGAVVANNPRSYRGAPEVLSYFTGTCDGGDCDAWLVNLSNSNDRSQHVCYRCGTDDAQQMT